MMMMMMMDLSSSFGTWQYRLGQWVVTAEHPRKAQPLRQCPPNEDVVAVVIVFAHETTCPWCLLVVSLIVESYSLDSDWGGIVKQPSLLGLSHKEPLLPIARQRPVEYYVSNNDQAKEAGSSVQSNTNLYRFLLWQNIRGPSSNRLSPCSLSHCRSLLSCRQRP